ncbi:MAG: tetratricopeptide repeat protein, partial [Acetobacteraceae bacterium]
EGFALLVLIVPDRDGAAICRQALADHLAGSGRTVQDLSPGSPVVLRNLAETLLHGELDPGAGAVWVAAAVPASAPDHPAWETAWRWGLATLNQNRNAIVGRYACTLVIVGTPWLVPLFREAAPDLWSLRSMVVHIEPGRDHMQREDRGRDLEPLPRTLYDGPVPDLELTQQAVERLRGLAGKEAELAETLNRLAYACLAQGKPALAEASALDALAYAERFCGPRETGISLDMLGRAIRDQGRAAEAEDIFRRAIALKQEGGDTPVSRGISLDNLGRAILDQGRAAEAEDVFRRAIALTEEGGGTPVSRGISLNGLGRAILDQGRAAEAEDVFRRAIALTEEGGGTPVSRGISLNGLGRAILDQGRAAEAEDAFRRAIALKEEGGGTPVSRGISLNGLGRAILDQGRAAEAEDVFRRALALARQANNPAGIRICTKDLATALRFQGKHDEADQLLSALPAART